MNPDEIDIALAELETRIDRLRALYEQYFMGIERLEPSVPRKDVDRRFQELRKTPFRNTAKRFKFQTLVQRYSTMQQYWQRICREIENGTYKRHKLRAERTIGGLTPTAEEATPAELSAAEPTSAERAATKSAAEEDWEALLSSNVDTKAELERALAEATASVEQKAPSPATGLLARLGQRGASPADEARKSVALPAPPRLGAGAPPPIGRPEGPTQPPRSTAAQPPAAGPAAPAPARPAVVQPPAPRPAASAPERPAVAQPLAPRPPAPAPPEPRAGGSSGLGEERLRALHQRYLEARARTNATAVSYEKLAQNVRETERKLREQHKGKKVDFDVVVKDGKAILKPRLV